VGPAGATVAATVPIYWRVFYGLTSPPNTTYVPVAPALFVPAGSYLVSAQAWAGNPDSDSQVACFVAVNGEQPDAAHFINVRRTAEERIAVERVLTSNSPSMVELACLASASETTIQDISLVAVPVELK
jgi:hypothetical protein